MKVIANFPLSFGTYGMVPETARWKKFVHLLGSDHFPEIEMAPEPYWQPEGVCKDVRLIHGMSKQRYLMREYPSDMGTMTGRFCMAVEPNYGDNDDRKKLYIVFMRDDWYGLNPQDLDHLEEIK